jgi:uncharacterized protein (DUF362 family)
MDQGDSMKLKRRHFLLLLVLLAAAAAAVASWLRVIKVFFRGPTRQKEAVRTDIPYRSGGKSPVVVVGGTNLEAMVREAVGRLGGFEKMGVRGRTVLVKPNVVGERRNPTTTNAALVGAVVKLLYAEGASRVYVGDMSAVTRLRTPENMERTGIRDAALRAGAEVLHLEEHGWVKVKTPRGAYLKEVAVSEWIYNVDRVVNLPVIKTHRYAGFSLCLKNFVGATHPKYRPYLVDRKHWEEVVAELNLAYTPALNIVDGTRSMVEHGPWKGEERETNLIIASGDRVAADAVGLGIVASFGKWKWTEGESIWEARQLRRAVQLGLGASGPEEMELIAVDLEGRPGFGDLVERARKHVGLRALRS